MKGLVSILTLIFWAKIVVSDASQYETHFQSSKHVLLRKINFEIQEIEYNLVDLKDSFATSRQFEYKSEAVLANIRHTIDQYSFDLEEKVKKISKDDITEVSCGALGRYRQLALGIYDNVKQCITNHVYSILDNAEDIFISIQKLHYSLITARDRITQCENVDCLNTVFETTTATLETVSRVSSDAILIGGLVATLKDKLIYCASLGPVSAIVNHYLKALAEIPFCATKQITNIVTSPLNAFLPMF